MKTVHRWYLFVFLTMTSCGGNQLQHMDATPYAQMLERPNGACPHSKTEQGILNKHPDAAIVVTVSEITAANVLTTTEMSVKANQTVYIGCAVLPSGKNADRKILNVRFE